MKVKIRLEKTKIKKEQLPMSKEEQSQARAFLDKYSINNLSIETLDEPEKGAELNLSLNGKTSLGLDEEMESAIVDVEISVKGESNLLYQVVIKGSFEFELYGMRTKEEALGFIKNVVQTEALDMIRVEIEEATSKFPYGALRLPPIDHTKMNIIK